MPRAKPTSIVVHRIEMGSLERKEAKRLLDIQVLNKRIDAGIKGVATVGALGVGAGFVYVGYQSYLLAQEIAASAGEAWSAAQKTYNNVATSLTAEKQKTYWSAFGDFFNPFVSRAEFDLKHNNDEQFKARYGKTKDQYMAQNP